MVVMQSAIDPGSDQFKENQKHFDGLLDIWKERMQKATSSGRESLKERHRARGKLLVRDRIDRLVDPGTAFLELSPLAAWAQYGGDLSSAGIVTGIGWVSGTPCMLIANDATVKGGSFFAETVKKHIRAQEIAEKHCLPCLYLVDCGGAYLPEQDRVFPDRDHFGNTFFRQCQLSSKGIPQISIVFGGCTAGGAYIPALSDQVIMVEGNARIHLGGPSIVKVAINEEVDGETLGGARMHTEVSGVSDHLASTEEDGLAKLRDIVSKLNMKRKSGYRKSDFLEPKFSEQELTGIVSHDRKIPYDIREIMIRLVDGSDIQEFKPDWGSSLVCGFAEIFGMPVGLLGNNGALFSESSLKGAQFIQLCDQRNIPLVFLHNITGFMVGTEAEQGGIAKNSAKMVYAMSVARVPRLSLIVGGSYGAGNYGMCGRGFRPDFLFAWPTAEVATMSADIAANVMLELRRGKHGSAAASQEELDSIEQAVRQQYGEQSDPYYATSRLWDDGIIAPDQTRTVFGLCLDIVCSTPKIDQFSPVYRM
ncbi:acyl-CoA carboxylase subunit beta [Sneathiella limimaris]|uniref:acyl-CoA carboxylase subunit beta n=1 Tax=Sneathiella limimaris TaxID=1964213 RepID=UPI00146D52AE|nr:carboxyl transferase domain-containing protein [Sneathiella limimaris]